jgi:hypothetical protein
VRFQGQLRFPYMRELKPLAAKTLSLYEHMQIGKGMWAWQTAEGLALVKPVLDQAKVRRQGGASWKSDANPFLPWAKRH